MTYRIYVGTYAKYNSGSIKGAWLDLEDYACKQDFYEACAELHSDEADPEYMFQDHEDIPKFFIGETCLSDDIWSYMDCAMDDEVKAAYVEAKEQWDEEEEFEIVDGGAPPTVDRCSIIGRIDVLIADKRDWCEVSCANARLHVVEVGGNEQLSNKMAGSLFDNFVNACVRSVRGRE